MTVPSQGHERPGRALKKRLAGRIGRPVQAFGFVTPAARGGWVWDVLSLGIDGSLVNAAAATVVGTAAVTGVAKRRARATGLGTRMVLATTAHDVHLFRMRALDRVISNHIVSFDFGAITDIEVRGKEPAKITIALADGSTVKLDGDRAQRAAFDHLRALAAAVPVGTLPPARPAPSGAGLAGVLASAAGHALRGAATAAKRARTARNTPDQTPPIAR
ncbi:unannotated protein [freshwater metagenome]|uniref:Unannotated protein n=1 Tax=freshwater metagenome TaxID=449393 RepID=A0A6J7KCZ9_9ZZZZ